MNVTTASQELFAEVTRDRLSAYVNEAYRRLTPKPGRKIIYAPGSQVAWDDCCDGQLWGRLAQISPMPSNNPGRIPGLNSACGSPEFLATFELGIIRCAATIDDQGRAPSQVAIALDGKQEIDDLAALMAAMATVEDTRSIVGYTPQGPEGGCHGGYWQFTVALTNYLEVE